MWRKRKQRKKSRIRREGKSVVDDQRRTHRIIRADQVKSIPLGQILCQ